MSNCTYKIQVMGTSHTNAHTQTHTLIHTHTLTQTHTNTDTHKHTHTNTHANTHSNAHIQTQLIAITYIFTHTHYELICDSLFKSPSSTEPCMPVSDKKSFNIVTTCVLIVALLLTTSHSLTNVD